MGVVRSAERNAYPSRIDIVRTGRWLISGNYRRAAAADQAAKELRRGLAGLGAPPPPTDRPCLSYRGRPTAPQAAAGGKSHRSRNASASARMAAVSRCPHG